MIRDQEKHNKTGMRKRTEKGSLSRREGGRVIHDRGRGGGGGGGEYDTEQGREF